MDQTSTAAGKQTPLTRALATIRQLKQKLAEREGRTPIAVVGVGLRLPGGITDLDGYWSALTAGADLVRPMPASRKGPFTREWENLPQRGGFLDEVLDFDADFFGISPREARGLDPQQRMLMEVTWEALEHAALPADQLGGTRSGFYLGIMWQDYREWLGGEPDAYWTTGNMHCFAAGRIAYTLGLTGPAVAVDTACSSSLVAVHLAAQALRRGECDVAFAAGTNLIMSPKSMRLVQETRSLSPDGLCRTFDARANGFTRGEGCAVVVLKRLDQAVRDGDRIHAVLRGSAINQDGRSGGFTAPNVLSQVSLIESALAEAGLEPADIGYVEAHGTGTALGDPIEMEALATALGRRNGGAPLPVGAVKTNFGHLEATAGIAGLVKAILCLRHRKIPPLVHFRTLNPRIDLSGTAITVPTELVDWAPEGGRCAGVSSFGMSGTNAHVILGLPEAEELAEAPEPAEAGPVTGFEISAKTPAALRELAGRYAERVAALTVEEYPAFAYTAGAGRTRHETRARITAADPASAAAALAALAAGQPSPAVLLGGTDPDRGADVTAADAPTGDDVAADPASLPRRVIDLPSYPWQRQRYAPEHPPTAAGGTTSPAGGGELPVTHELDWRPLGTPTTAGGPALVLAGDDGPLLARLVREAAARGVSGVLLTTAALPEVPGVDVPVPTGNGSSGGAAAAAAQAGWAHGVLPADRSGWRDFWAEHAPAVDVRLALVMKPTPWSPPSGAAGPDPAVETGAAAGAGPHAGTDPVADGCAALTAAVAATAEAGATDRRVFALTRATRRIGDADPVLAGGHGAVHGLAPVLGLEFGGAWGGLVDLPAEPTDDDVRAAVAFLAGRPAGADPADPDRSEPVADPAVEDLVAVRDGRLLAPRLRPAAGYAPQLTVRADATYLVTGGLGAVGRQLVTELVQRGARHLLLIGRRPEQRLSETATAFIADLRQAGVSVVYRDGGCDTAEAVAAAQTALADLPEVRGVIHAAGTVERIPAAQTGPEHFAAALRDKTAGAWWLHLASRDWPLDFFLLVSSVSAVWGTEGCAAYAAANGALDNLAAYRRAAGLPAVSIGYGPWALDGAGMADEESRALYARLGVGALDAATGRATLTGQAPGAAGYLVACPLDLARLGSVLSGLRPRGLFSTATAPGAPGTAAETGIPGDAASAAPPEPSIVAELAALPERARPAAARSHVARLLAAQLGHADPKAIRQDAGFFGLGLDSIMAVDLVQRLSAAFEVELIVADVFDHPTVAELADFILAQPPAPPRATASTAGSPPAPAVPASPAPAAPSPAALPVPAVPASSAAPGGAGSAAAPAPAAVTAPVGPATTAVHPAAHPADDSAGTAGEPIAIVGMAGRFPQADSVEELWELLREGRDAVGPVPPERWDRETFHGTDQPARITSDQGGFLRDIARFDAGFFDIPVREAESLDPQQRLLLESAWHALEDAGIDPTALRNSRTGVFVGVSYGDYARVLARGGPEQVDAYYSTGTALNALAGRLAYVLGLNGPAIAVDTACSSSLVALHLAVRSLRAGETDAILAGGVNVILDPLSSVAVSRAHMLSPDGRCRTFSADANGFVRAEGCGVLVLKRLSDARRDGDRILAVIRGSAVNQDGASSGLTAPSGRAQEAMLTAALADAGVTGAEVSFLEAHGTGTSLGDPVELAAAWRVLSPGRRPGEPLHVGSVKSNIGHCESAAGMAGVIKTVLALRHDLIPANLHFHEPNPHVAWADMNVRVVDTPTRWRPAGDRPRVAGVSGFGFTGTNAHVILADPPATPVEAPAGDAPAAGAAGETCLLPLSAPDEAGLARVTQAWRRRLESATEEELPALAARAATGRAHFPYRRALLGRTREQLLAAADEPGPVRPAGAAPRIAFLFSGQGSQYFGMGRELYETEPVFREVFDRCDQVLAPTLGASLAELIYHGPDREAINETRLTQPALVTLEVALAALWESWGVSPAVVLGHSVGEIAAAIHAGVMDLATGLRLIADRARLMQDTERGAMLAVVATEAQVSEWIAGTGLDLAAVNGPEATVVSGAPAEVDALAARLKEQGVRNRRLSVSHAFHSRLLDPAMAPFAAALAPLEFRAPAVPIISNVTGEVAAPDTYHAEYWCRHARQPVRFHDGARQLAALDVDICLEIGPDRTLVNLVQAAGLAPAGGIATSLRRGSPDRTALLTAAKTLYGLGQDLTWSRVYAGRRRHVPDTPRYPFADTRYWSRAAASAGPVPTGVPGGSPAGMPGGASGVPDLAGGPAWGVELRSPALHGRVFRTERSTEYPPHLTDHRLYGVVSVPGASQTATALSALGADGSPIALADLHFPRALVLRDGERYELQVIDAEQDGRRTVTVQSLLDPERGHWQEHLVARVVTPEAATGRRAPDPEEFIATAERHVTGEQFYAHLRALGYLLGPSFRWIADAWIRGDEALIRFAEPAEMNEDPAGYQIHPGLLDSCLQSSVAFAVEGDPADLAETTAIAIPFAAAKVDFPGRPAAGQPLWGHVRAVRRPGRPGDLLQVSSADLHMFDAAGSTVLAVDGFRFRSAPRELVQRSLREGVRHAYQLDWVPAPARPAAAAASGRRLVLFTGEADGVGAVGAAGAAPGTSRSAEALRAAFEALGHRVSVRPVFAEPAETGVDLVVDLRFAEPAEWAGPGGPADSAEPAGPGERFGSAAALAAAETVAASLRSGPRDLPYAVLAAASPTREALWGMLASLEAEQRDRRLLRVDLASGWDADLLARELLRRLDADDADTRLEVGADQVRVARLVPYRSGAAPAGTAGAETGPAGAALITGGTGALGLAAAELLARHGAAAITLMARSAPDPVAQQVIDELTAAGTPVQVVRGDVTDPAACARAVAEAEREHPLRVVLHLAGTTDDHAFEHLDAAAFERVFAAKATGAANLVAAVAGRELESLVFFSSASAVLGSAGQVNYAAANGYLDGLAEALRAEGVPATSIAWGPWTPRAKGGLAASAATGRAIERIAVRPLADEEAAELLRLALQDRPARLVAVAVDPERYAAQLAGRPGAALLSALTTGPAQPAAPAVAQQPRGWLRQLLDGLDPQEREDRLRQAVREAAGDVLGDRSAVEDDLGFSDLGLDSIMVIDLRTRLAHGLDTELPATVALDYPTVLQMSDHVLGLLYPGDSDRSTPAGSAPAEAPSRPAAPPSRPAPPPVADEVDPASLSFEELIQAVQADVAAER